MPDNNFEELISININTDSFTKTLKELSDAYDTFVQGIAEKSKGIEGPLSAAVLGTFSTDLKEMAGQFGVFVQGFQRDFTALGDQITQTLTTVTEQVTNTLAQENASIEGATAESIRISTQSYKDQWEAFQLLQSMEVQLREETLAKLSAADQRWYARTADNPDRLNQLSEGDVTSKQNQAIAQNLKMEENATKQREGLVNKQADVAWAAFERETVAASDAQAKQVRIVAEGTAQIEKTREAAFAQAEALNVKRLEAEQKFVAESEALEAKLARQMEETQAAAINFIASKQIAAQAEDLARTERLNAEKLRIAQKLAEDQARLSQQLADAQTLSAKIAAERMVRANQRVIDAEKKATEKAANAPSMLSNIGSMLLGLGEIQIAWAAVGLAISAAMAPFKLMTAFFKNGFDYLTDLQEQSAELTVSLSNSTIYSKDFAENLRMAAIYAPEIVKALQDAAIEKHLDLSRLMQSYKGLLESGLPAFTNTSAEQIKVATDLNLVIKAGAAGTRQINQSLNDIPKLLDGSITKTSELLRVLHLTPEAWEKIRQSALKHKDLLQQIEDKLGGLIKAGETIKDTNISATAQIELSLKRMGALAVQPLWDAWSEKLKKIEQYLKDHQKQIQTLLDHVAKLISSLLSLGSALLGVASAFSANDKPGDSFLGRLDAIVAKSAKLVDLFTKLTNLLKSPVHMFTDTTDDIAGGVKWLLGAPTENNTEGILSPLPPNPKTPGGVASPFTGAAVGAAKALLNQQVTGPMPLDNTPKGKFPGQAQLEVLKGDYKNALDAIKGYEENLREDTKQMVAARVLSTVQGSVIIMKSLKDELDAVKILGDNYEKLAKHVKDTRPGAVNKFQGAITDTSTKTETSMNKQAIAEQGIITKDDIAIQRANQNAALKLTAQGLAEKLALIREEVSQGRKLQSDGIQAEIKEKVAAHAVEVAILRQNLADAKNNVLERTKAENAFVAAQAKSVNDLALLGTKLSDALKKESLERLNQTVVVKRQAYEMAAAQAAADEVQHRSKQKLLDDNLKLAKANTAVAKAAFDAGAKELADSNLVGSALDALKNKVEDLRVSLKRAINTEADASSNAAAGTIGGGFKKGFFGEAGGDDPNGQHPFKTFKIGIQSAAAALNALGGVVNSVISAYKQGGAGAAIGAGLSAAGNMPGLAGTPVGAVLSIAGTAVSLINGIFMAQAQKIADDVKKGFEGIMKSYSNGSATLNETIIAAEKARQDAIRRLSGKKGGDDLLKGMLPGMDDQIASLKKEQKQVLENFQTQLNMLRLGSDVLGSFAKSWADINTQVKAYIGAGGDLAKANEYLSLSLKKLKADAVDSLASGEKQAIDDAKKLNDLLTQRTKLIMDEKKAEFDLLNGDAIERRQSHAIAVGAEIQNRRKEYNKQLADLESQINLMTLRVKKEKEVFGIATDLASLRALSNKLELDALDKQIAKWNDLKKLISGIYQKPDGSYGLDGGFGSSIGVINVTINNSGGGPVDPKKFVDDLRHELHLRGRYGLAGYDRQSA